MEKKSFTKKITILGVSALSILLLYVFNFSTAYAQTTYSWSNEVVGTCSLDRAVFTVYDGYATLNARVSSIYDGDMIQLDFELKDDNDNVLYYVPTLWSPVLDGSGDRYIWEEDFIDFPSHISDDIDAVGLAMAC